MKEKGQDSGQENVLESNLSFVLYQITAPSNNAQSQNIPTSNWVFLQFGISPSHSESGKEQISGIKRFPPKYRYKCWRKTRDV